MQTTKPRSTVGSTQPVFARSQSLHLIEAQALFVPTLTDVFREIGLHVDAVSSDVDLHGLLEEKPDILFVDTDYLKQEPLRAISLLSVLVPDAIICVYTNERSAEWANACHFAGAMAVLSKNAHRSEIVEGMHEAMQRHSYTDVRLRRNT